MNVYVFILATFPLNWDCDITPAEIEFPIIARLRRPDRHEQNEHHEGT
jgi:hypothetical protein